MKPDDTVCFCYGVSLRKLVNYIRRERPPVASLVSRCLSAGTGCGWCVPFLKRLHGDVMAGRFDSMDSLAFDEYERMRVAWLAKSKPDREDDDVDEAVLAGSSGTATRAEPRADKQQLQPLDLRDFT